MAQESVSWMKKSAPETVTLKGPESESVLDDNLEDDAQEVEDSDQPAEIAPEFIQPLLPLIEMKMINGMVPFVTGPDSMGSMLKTSIENRYKDMIKNIVIGVADAPAAKSEGELTKAAVTGGGWWSK